MTCGPLVGGSNAGRQMSSDVTPLRVAVVPRLAPHLAGAFPGGEESQPFDYETYVWEDLWAPGFSAVERPGFWRLDRMPMRDALLDLLRGYRRP